MACTEYKWCSYLCGEDCENGEGGVCYFERTSRLEHTCSVVKKRMEEEGETVEYYLKEEEQRRLEGHGIDTHLADDGCVCVCAGGETGTRGAKCRRRTICVRVYAWYRW